jgi:hypothetical protein
MPPPSIDGFSRFGQAQEHVPVETLVAQPAVKRFNEGRKKAVYNDPQCLHRRISIFCLGL